MVCVELDARLLPFLTRLAAFDNVEIVNAGHSEDRSRQLIDEAEVGMEVSGAAPIFPITSPRRLSCTCLESAPHPLCDGDGPEEAAKRITARPGTRDAGAISLAIRYYADPQYLFNVSGQLLSLRPTWILPSSAWIFWTGRRFSPKDEALFSR